MRRARCTQFKTQTSRRRLRACVQIRLTRRQRTQYGRQLRRRKTRLFLRRMGRSEGRVILSLLRIRQTFRTKLLSIRRRTRKWCFSIQMHRVE